ncbi:MAG TPA: esterase-like activity of phytase family protein [Pseudolabrys sp.]|nr:esterase-like activity of phytase family protein [Pseudolabrys sp.]
MSRAPFAVGLALVALLIAAGADALAAPRYSRTHTSIAVEATPIAAFDNRDPTRVRFGALEFRGGLALTSSYEPFGGISALHVEPDGSHFLSLTDNGSWLRGRIVYDHGRPAGIADAEMAPLLGPDGRALAARGWFDSESLAESDGTLYVGIERVEKILRFDYAHHGLTARGEAIDVPDDFKTFTYNKSLECLAVPPKGAPLAGQLIAVTERSLDAAGNHRSFVFDNGRVARFTVKRDDDFDVSDCTVLPPGDLLLLERRFSPARGLAIRIRRIALAAIKPGAKVDGPTLIEADLAYQIDNMEGIAVHRNAAGETIITLVSDDNFSVLQRTLLLQFAIVGE